MKDIGFVKKVIAWFKALSATQLAVGGAATALMVAGAIGGVALMNTLGTSGNGVNTENTQMLESLIPGTTTEATEELEMTEVTEVIEEINVSITTTSIERDLKIKIVDENGNLVNGKPFVVTVTFDGEDKEYDDHDMDGIIYIKDIEGGDYVVKLHELEGIIIEEPEVSAKVKAKIEYEKVEIENEIKDESQINASVEDTANNNVVEEAPIQDTLTLLESTATTTEISSDKVDLTKLPAAVVSSDKVTATMTQYAMVEVEEEENGTETVEPDEGSVTGEDVTGQDGGSAQIYGLSVGTTGQTQTVPIGTAKAYLPKTIKLYTLGSEASTSASISLQIEDEKQLITSYAWSIKDASVATLNVAEDKKSAQLVALKEGTTKVVVSFVYISDEDGITTGTCDLECEITVSKHTDNTTQLVDVDGNLLYGDSEAKNIATPADLATKTTFYSSPKYTGWQTIDGYLYYYTEENVPATGQHVIGGVTYEFHEDGKLKEREESLGIDVSKWQASIDWEAVANAGIDFAIIRCGYRGSSTGAIVEDKYFQANIKGATENGIKVGVYFFTQAITEAEAVEEASAALELVKGYKLNYPIFIDTEGSGGRADSLGKAERTAIVKAFCETIRNGGYKPGIYASKYWYYDNLDVSQLSTYNIWVAQYNTSCDYRNRYDMWQYTSKGSVPGIKGNVDMNISYTKY